MANNLKDHLKEVADAIRAKKGTTDLINPQNFATEIEGISGSGGESDSNIEYLDVSGDGTAEIAVTTFAWLAKAYSEGMTVIGPLIAMIDEGVIGGEKKPSAVMIDLSAKLYLGNGLISIKEVLLEQAHGLISEADIDSIPRLTKEQFYDLNA